MGYYSDFTFTPEDRNLDIGGYYDDLFQELIKLSEYSWEGRNLYYVKWYDTRDHALTVSRDFPNKGFVISQTGEYGEKCRRYYKYGTCVHVQPVWPDSIKIWKEIEEND